MTDWVKVFARWSERYRYDPVRFIREVIGYEPDPWQAEVASAMVTNKWVTVRSGQGVGKSTVAASVLLWFLTCFPNARIVCTAPTYAQVSVVIWAELHKQTSRNPIFTKILTLRKHMVSIKGAEARWFAMMRVAIKAENMQGIHEDNMLFIVDEASGIRDEILEAVLGTLSGVNNRLLMIGNPTKPNGIFFDSHNSSRGSYASFRVNAEESPRTSKENIERLGKSYGKESNVYRVRVLGEFPTSEDDAFISLPLVEAAMNVEPDTDGEMAFGVDVARYGDDKTVIAVKHGNMITMPIKRHGQNLMQTVGDIVKLYREMQKTNRGKLITVYVDDTGLGGGVTDRLHEVAIEKNLQYMKVMGINFGSRAPNKDAAETYSNMGTWLWANIKNLLRANRLLLPNDTDLVAQLTARKYVLTSTGHIALESKDSMKKRSLPSPDLADAVALACYQELSDYTVVFSNITVRKIKDDERNLFAELYFGIEFGYHPEPLHFAEMCFDSLNQTLYIYSEKRLWKSSNENTAQELSDYQGVRIRAGKDDKKSVSDLSAWGFQIFKAKSDDADYSTKWLQSLKEIVIDPEKCPHTRNEFTTYEYGKDYDDTSIKAVKNALEEIWRIRGQ